jgi:replicative DNA helicase
MSENNTPDPDEMIGGLRPYQLWSAKSQKMLDAWERGDPSAGYKTGLVALDKYIRLVPGELTVLAARPGMGKTSLLMQIAGNMVPNQEGKDRVAIFSAEMSGVSLNLRLASAVSQVSLFSLRSQAASELEYEATRRAIEGLKNLPLLIDDTSRPSAEYMRKQIGLMAQAYKLNCVMIDFLELLDAEGRSEEQRVSNAVVTLKELAKQYNLPVLVISHLNRSVEDRADKMPQLADLRYSGMIEQIADQVILLTRPKYYLDKGMNVDLKPYQAATSDGLVASNITDIAYLLIAKNRNGDTGIVRLGFSGQEMRFYDIRRTKLPQPNDFTRDPEVEGEQI